MSGKVLVLENLGSDYGAYFLAKGFVDLLGADRVCMWPYKRTHNGGRDRYPERLFQGQAITPQSDGTLTYTPYRSGSELWNHPALWRAWKPEKMPSAPMADDGPVHFYDALGVSEVGDDEIFAMLRRGEFSMLLLNGARWHSSAALSELRSVFSSLPPVAFYDGEDYPQLRFDFVSAFDLKVYFKRTLLVGQTWNLPHTAVHPLPFAAPWNLSWLPWESRDIDVLCVFGNTQILRRKVKESTLEVAARYPGLRVMAEVGHPLAWPEWMATLRRSKIVIDHQRYGTDTVRFWEAASAGCCLVSDSHLAMPEQPTPGRHYLQYENDLSMAGNAQTFEQFQGLLAQAIEQPAATEAMARSLYDLVREHHRPVDRAQFVVAKMREAGFGLLELP